MTDPSNAVVAGADVKLVDTTTGQSQSTSTNEAGRYVFVNIPLGTYNVEISKTGFAKARVDGQTVSVGATTTINVALKLGQATEVITVEASGAQLQTTNATVGSTIGFQSLQELPNLGRDASALMELQPGVSVNGDVAGAVRDQNTFQLDGGNNTSDMDGTQSTYTPSFATGGVQPTGVLPTPVESIEEFKVNVTNQTTDFNGSAGAQVQMVTRRGGKNWHGSVYDFYFGSNMGANLWTNNHVPVLNGLTGAVVNPITPLPSNHYNRFGASAGGPVGPKFLGGKTYVFLNYEGRRYPQNVAEEKNVPSALLRLGIIQVQDSAGNWNAYNLNPTPINASGAPCTIGSAGCYAPAQCGSGNCDPRSIGLDPYVKQVWKLYEPIGNDTTFTSADAHNTVGYLSSIKLPQNDNNGVARLDHDFGDKWHFMGSFRYYELSRATDDQYDIGGLLGGSLGSPYPTSNRPQYPWLYVAQMTTAVTPTLSNNFNYSFLRNWWQWGTKGGVPQAVPGLPALGGTLEIGGESANALIPYNVQTQATRSRVWDGHDQTWRDDLALIHGNHLFTFGGSVQHNWDLHSRNDNGGGIDVFPTYQIAGTTSTISGQGFSQPTSPSAPSLPGSACSGSCIPSSQAANYQQLYAEVLGIVTQSQTVYVRSMPNLALSSAPPATANVAAHVATDYYSGYWGDSWKMKPSITLTYGLSYLLQMPPFEKDSKQVMLVDQNDQPVYVADYLKQKQASALNPSCTGNFGQMNATGPLAGYSNFQCTIYNPILGFATVNNVGGGRKYPYDVFYGGFSPHAAVAWNPHFDNGILHRLTGGDKTVLRGGYSKVYGRLNGVANILTPLLTPGLLQAAQCNGVVNQNNAVGGSQCTGSATSSTAFRIGSDCTITGSGCVNGLAPLPSPTQTLPQPYIPGVGANFGMPSQFLTQPVGDALGLDPSFRPNVVDSFDLTIQRQVSSKAFIELGYIGRYVSHELIDLDINAVPYMTTLGGESYADAFGKLYTSLCGLTGPTCATTSAPTASGATAYQGPVLPFFENAMNGPTSPYCTGFSSCTAAVASKLYSSISTSKAYSLWNSLSQQKSWVLGRTLPASQFPGGCVAGVASVCTQTAAVGQSLSTGTSNYNAGFVTFTLRDWHGVTGNSNFTWSHALGEGATRQSTSLYTVPDPWNVRRSFYGEQSWDTKFIFSQGLTWHPTLYRNQAGLLGHILGGWGLSPLFTAQSGFPKEVDTIGDCQSFGESNCDDSTFENAVLIGSIPAMTTNYGVTSSGAAGKNGNITSSCIVNGGVTCGGVGLNAWADPQAVYQHFRLPVLGVDCCMGGTGRIRGFARWNLDLQVTKNTKFTERFNAMFYATMTNVLNHFQPSDPSTSLNSVSNWGRISAQAFDPRKIELGLRVGW